MVLEVLIVLLLVGAVGATLLSFFVVRSNKAAEKSAAESSHDVDNPQRDIDSQ
jgi:type II secretory pathway pseudopilin PulG